MPLDRREFLIAASAAAVACKPESPDDTDAVAVPAPVRDPSPAPFEAPGPEDRDVFPRAVALGDPTPDGVMVVVHSTADSVEVVLARHFEGAWAEAARFPARETLGGSARFEVSGLDADTPYAAWAEVDGVRSRVTHFRTAPEPDVLRQVRFVATSCLGGASDLANLSFMADHDPDAVLLLGDTGYCDGNVTAGEYTAFWNAHARRDRVRDLFAAGAVVATWDDHEVANNWVLGVAPNSLFTGVSQQQIDDATDAWRSVVPMRLGPGGTGIWRTLRFGATLELFVLDCRGERSPGKIMSDTQLDWLVAALQASEAHFKVVLTSVHATDHFELIGVVQDEDRWQGYTAQRAALITAAAAVPGTVFVTGDMHYGAVQRLDPEGGAGADLREIAVGPAGSTLFPVPAIMELGGGPLPQYETVIDDWTFSVIDFDPGLGTVRVQFVDDAGVVRVEQTLEGL
ncbi:MAG: alkaline phosphatase D family protein [Myxococcota bacterium]